MRFAIKADLNARRDASAEGWATDVRWSESTRIVADLGLLGERLRHRLGDALAAARLHGSPKGMAVR